MAIPETDRIEDKTENPGETLQADVPIRKDAVFGQQCSNPRQRVRTIALAMIGKMKTEEIETIDREQRTAKGFNAQ